MGCVPERIDKGLHTTCLGCRCRLCNRKPLHTVDGRGFVCSVVFEKVNIKILKRVRKGSKKIKRG